MLVAKYLLAANYKDGERLLSFCAPAGDFDLD